MVPPRGRMPRTSGTPSGAAVALQRAAPAVSIADELVPVLPGALADDRPDHRVEAGAVAAAGEHSDPHRLSLEAGRARREEVGSCRTTEGGEMSDAPDLGAVTQIQQQTWSEGDFAMVANLVYNASRDLVEALDIVPDERVLDVACGSGNGAIAAARRAWGNTVGADFVPALLERGRERAAAERLEIEFVEADAQDLPFEDAELRRRDLDLRRDVRPRPGADRRRAAARGQTRRPDRDGQLDPRRRRRRDVHDDRQARAAAARASTRRCSGAPRSGCGSCSATASPTCGSSAESRARRSARADHYLEFFRTYFGPIKMAFERVGADGEAGARPATCGPSSRRRTRPATERWCSSPSTCRSSRPAPRESAR